MKFNLSKLLQLSIIPIALTAITSSQSFAQCNVNTLDISTGYYNGSNITSGNTDPNWYITDRTGDYGSTPASPFNAIVENNAVYSFSGHADYLVAAVGQAATGITATQNSSLTYAREFRLCDTGTFAFNLNIYDDDYVTAIAIDGVSLSITQTVSLSNYTGAVWTPSIPNQFLTAGTHTLEITVESNYNLQPSQQPNAIGLLVDGTLTDVYSNTSIVNDQDSSCAGYDCNPIDTTGCDDLCYWRVIGNNINGGNNIFGTLNSYSVNIQTEGHERGILTPGGSNATDATAGRFGWNTMSPTARLHVDCINGNEDGSGTSDIRFENLESGEGYILVIDDAGYVYNTYMSVSDLSGMAQELRTEKNKNDELQKRVDALTARVGMLEQNTTGADNLSNLNNKLYQNTPNPFDKSTTIKYSIKSMNNSAYIIVYDLNGRELNKTAVEGDGSITIDDNTLTPGMYLYSLVIDGVAVDTKRMVLSK